VIDSHLLTSLAKRAEKQSANWRRLQEETPDKNAATRYAVAAHHLANAAKNLHAAATSVQATHTITALQQYKGAK
jgi:hypothetical protein